MSIYLGIDGGGTRTRAFVTDEQGLQSAWGEAGQSNPNYTAVHEVEENLLRASTMALEKLKLSPKDCTGVFLGLAGVTTEASRSAIQELVSRLGFHRAQLGVDHDIRIALAGGLAMKPGIALIVGTGSSCYGRAADGRTWQTGGWEALISDEGSGFYLAREAMSAAARMSDGRETETPLRQKVFQWLGIGRIAEILARVQDRALTRSEIAAFAPEVIRLAEAGDPAALDILGRGAFLLAEMVAANHRMLPTGPGPDVVITGGLGTASGIYRQRITAAVQEMLNTVCIQSSILPPAVGAALLAMGQNGRAITAELIGNLKRGHCP